MMADKISQPFHSIISSIVSAVLICFLSVILYTESSAQNIAKPRIIKLGTIDCDMVEVAPVVFKGRLYRFEYVRHVRYKSNTTGDSYFRFVDVEKGEATTGFAAGYHLGSAFVEGNMVYAVGTSDWGGSEIRIFRSGDMEHWESWTAWEKEGWQLYNTSVTKDDSGFIMAVEVGAPPEVVGKRFTMRFLRSKDLENWTLMPEPCVFTKERYSACPELYFLDDWYYMTYLEDMGVENTNENGWHWYALHMVRTKDFTEWEMSPVNPVLQHSDEDRKIANPALTLTQREKIRTAVNLNNSDIDICMFEGKTIIYYSWGDQHGTEFLAEAVYNGSMDDFYRGHFPKE